MKCPHPNCGAEARVLNTRARRSGKDLEPLSDGVHRQRECAKGHRFSTVERVVGADAPLPRSAQVAARDLWIRVMLQTMSVNEVAKKLNISRFTVWRATRKE